jgi:hypothetical protein
MTASAPHALGFGVCAPSGQRDDRLFVYSWLAAGKTWGAVAGGGSDYPEVIDWHTREG